MSEEIIEEEFGEGIDLDEIAKKYEERGFFKRLSDMFKGASPPRSRQSSFRSSSAWCCASSR